MVVALCENCSSGAAFTSVIEDEVLSFRVAGMFNGTFFTEDLETGTYWAPFTGEAIYGRHLGAILEPLPLYQCYWAEWKELHPGTFVERGIGEPRDGHGAGTSPGSMTKIEKRMVKVVPRDRRLRPNVLVLGVKVGSKSRAYPLDELHEFSPALNDTVGGHPIVIFSRPQSLIGMAFSRELDGQVLNLEADGALKFRDSKLRLSRVVSTPGEPNSRLRRSQLRSEGGSRAASPFLVLRLSRTDSGDEEDDAVRSVLVAFVMSVVFLPRGERD